VATPDDLTDLIDNPSETLAVEYKSGSDLSDSLSKAKFARHVAALANYGGGCLVFGFNDDMTRADRTEFPTIDRDAVAGIVKSYLDPAFQCEVRTVTARDGVPHTIVVVPSHGAVPICAKRGGPQDNKGRPQGILSCVYYIRKPGPASEPIVAPYEWTPLLRRCVLAERAAILAAISVALEGVGSGDAIEPGLRRWHEALAKKYRELLLPAALANGYTQFSFCIHHHGTAIEHGELLRVVEQCNAKADAITQLHWGPFAVFHQDPPRFRTAPDLDDGELEFLEAIVSVNVREMWRVSCGGFASLVKPWWEDDPRFGSGTPKTSVSPTYLAKDIVNCVLFARAFANSFDAATAVTFRCEWIGFEARRPFDPFGRWFFSGHASEDDRRVSSSTVTLADMNASWEKASAKPAGPAARAVGLDHVLTAEWFTNQAANWKRQP